MKIYKLHYGYDCCQSIEKEDYPLFERLLNDDSPENLSSFQSLFSNRLYIMPVNLMGSCKIITKGFCIDSHEFIRNSFDDRCYLVFRVRPDEQGFDDALIEHLPFYHHYLINWDYNIENVGDANQCNANLQHFRTSREEPRKLYDSFSLYNECKILELCEVSRI